MTMFEMTAIFMAVVAFGGWLNASTFHLPTAVAMLLVGLIGSAVLIAAQRLAPSYDGTGYAVHVLAQVDFTQTVLGYMLAFLLFAGSMQVDLSELKRERIAVWTLATLGVLSSTAIVGVGVFLFARLLGFGLSLPWACVFGALISPTDPIAVLATVRGGELPKFLKAILQGEALFNDGVGIVVFTAALAFALGGGSLNPLAVLGTVVLEAAGALVLGLLAGMFVVRAMQTIDDYAVEVSLSLALALGVYSGAQALHLSGPIAVVAAGLVVGDSGVRTAMSDTVKHYLLGLWTLVDEILNALLFLLLGLQVLVLPFDLKHAGLWLVTIPLVLLARLATVLPWGAYFRFQRQERGTGLLLTWGGLHGALSLALALTIPMGKERALILSLTYATVVFSVLVQGLTFGRLVARLRKAG